MPASGKSTTIATLCMFGVTLLFSLLPLLGVGEYKSSGEGFCYMDWRDGWHVALICTVLLPSTAATITFYALSMRSGAHQSSATHLPKPATWLLFIFYFLLTWCLWFAGAFYFISEDPFPKGLMISGGVLGVRESPL